MIETIMLCVVWAWLPGEGNTNYEFFGNDVLIGATTDTQIEACVPAYDTPVTYHVVGLNDAGDRSEPSNTITAKAVYCMDADQDGVVGMSDFGRFTQQFGKCNDGRKVVPCETL